MTVVLIALCGSLAAIVHDSGTDFTRVFQILVLLLCGSLIGALVSNYLPKSLASSLSGRAGTESESFLRKQQAALWRLTKSTNIHGGVFEEAGLTPVAEPGRWKAEHSFQYLLPEDSCAASQLIGEVFRTGYGLGDFSVINMWYHEPRVS